MTDLEFVKAWIERERAKGLLDIKLMPHSMSNSEAVKAFAHILREIDAATVRAVDKALML